MRYAAVFGLVLAVLSPEASQGAECQSASQRNPVSAPDPGRSTGERAAAMYSLIERAIQPRHYTAAMSSLIRLASASIAKGLVSTCMPGARWPLPRAAFSA